METRVSSSCQEWRQVFLSRPYFSATPHRKHVPYELPLRETTLVLRAWRAPLKGARRRVVPAQKVAMMAAYLLKVMSVTLGSSGKFHHPKSTFSR